MKKLVCLVLCFTLVFGLYAQGGVGFDSSDETPVSNSDSDISPPLFILEEETTSAQTAMFGTTLQQFSLDTGVVGQQQAGNSGMTSSERLGLLMISSASSFPQNRATQEQKEQIAKATQDGMSGGGLAGLIVGVIGIGVLLYLAL